MGTTADKLNKVLQTKEAIRTAINNKGGTLTTSDKFSDYAIAIDNIQSGGGDNLLQYIIDNQEGDGVPSCNYLFYQYKGTSLDDILNNIDISKSKKMISMFYGCSNLISIPQINTSNVTNMVNMFYNCSSLTTIPQINTSNVTNMNYMFYNCSSLTTIPQINTSNVTNMINTFYGCSSLKEIPILDTSKVLDFESAFYGCKNLTSIKLDTSSFLNMQEMIRECYKLETLDITYLSKTSTFCFNYFAYDCYSLKKIIIRNIGDNVPGVSKNAEFANCYHLYGTINETYNPEGLRDGKIYVPDDKIDYMKGKWKDLADIFRPLDIADGSHISNLKINNYNLSLTNPRNAIIYLDGFTNNPTVNINVNNESIAQINNIITTTEKITFEVIALGEEGNTTITVNVSGDYSKTLTIEVSYFAPIEHRVEQVSEATHGFTLNSNEYYESTNKGIAGSYSLCKLVFNATETKNILKLECINSGESNYDFGILSNIDTTLSLSSNEDSTNVYKSFKGQSSTKPVVITYPEATVGEHFIYIKYIKDGGGDSGNDSLQFRVIT